MDNADPTSPAQRLAASLAECVLLRRGKVLWQANQKDWRVPLSKTGKIQAGIYIILRDFADGRFPPRFEDQQKAYEAEQRYDSSLPGITPEAVRLSGMIKPFWSAKVVSRYLEDFCRLVRSFDRLGVAPPGKVLELGCGKGWMAEMLAQMGYRVLATTIATSDVEHASARIGALRAKGIPVHLDFRVSAMEAVHEVAGEYGPFDGVFVYEALHHAYDWRAALTSAGRCLRPGGWLLLANEPNLLHTCISYRVARLSDTHEIGMSRRRIRAHLLAQGYSEVRILNRRPAFFAGAHWIAARAPVDRSAWASSCSEPVGSAAERDPNSAGPVPKAIDSRPG